MPGRNPPRRLLLLDPEARVDDLKKELRDYRLTTTVQGRVQVR